ncbi:MAG: AAA family ATPase [Bryobacteraceae bacterium]
MPLVILRVVEYYPSEIELVRLLRTTAPQALVLSTDDLRAATGVARQAETHAPGIQLLGIGWSKSPEVLLELMRVGVREFLQAPFEGPVVEAALHHLLSAAPRMASGAELTERVYSFLPSKPGVGATTIAVNLGVLLAEAQKDKEKVLLADFDLNSGLCGFLLKLQNLHSVVDAANHAFSLDESLWRQLVCSAGDLDVLPSGKLAPGWRIDPAQIRSMLDFWRRHYSIICLDHSGNLEKYSIELLHESRHIFLVCTAELPVLHLARERLALLRTLELEGKVRLVLNRATRKDVIGPEEVERLLGLPIHAIVPNDYKGVHRAIALGETVDRNSELGKRLRQMAESLLNGEESQAPQRPRFVEYFTLAPARYGFMPGKQDPAG